MPDALLPKAPPRPAPSTPLEAGLAALAAGEEPLLAALEALRRRGGALRALWCTAHEGVWIADGRRPRRSRELPTEVPRRWLTSAGAGVWTELGAHELARAPRARATGLGHALVRRGRGGVLWLEARGRLVREALGGASFFEAFEGLAGLAEERARADRRRELERRGELAAGVAHDLRNQLALALLEHERARTLELVERDAADAALRRARELCEDFLRRGAAPLASELATLVRAEVHGALRLAGRGDDVRVLTRCAIAPEARAEESALRRVLQNLVLNALHASPAGGEVRVELREEDEGATLALEVVDTGRGMGRAERERLFRPGESLDGTGFGTSSVRDGVARLGGVLEVDSRPRAGTRVTVRWPRR
ncbi:MAG: sensor histidine kinase [Planctomycetes bacterium]|nr:sensor histidine kinase [Planctomycetota bacterium]